MRLRYSFLSLLIFVLILSSCKKDADKEISDSNLQAEVEEVGSEEPTKNVISAEESRRMSNSVMARVMSDSNCKTFASYLVSAELSEMLLNDEGPITIFAPSNEAMGNLDEETVKNLLNMESKELLKSAVRAHVVEGSYDSVTITQALKQGRVNLTALNGETLRVSQSGNDIFIEDSKGNKAKVGNSDITGTNGVVHVVDAFLGLD